MLLTSWLYLVEVLPDIGRDATSRQQTALNEIVEDLAYMGVRLYGLPTAQMKDDCPVRGRRGR